MLKIESITKDYCSWNVFHCYDTLVNPKQIKMISSGVKQSAATPKLGGFLTDLEKKKVTKILDKALASIQKIYMKRNASLADGKLVTTFSSTCTVSLLNKKSNKFEVKVNTN